MSLKINFTDVEGGAQPAPLPAGRYIARVTDGEIKESGPQAKNPGAQYINWELTVAEGDYNGRKIWTNTSLLPHALFGLKGLLESAGYDVSGELDFDIEDVCGKTVGIRVIKRAATTLADGREISERSEVKSFYLPETLEKQQKASLLP